MDLLIQIHCRLSKNDFHAVYYLLNKIMSPMKHTTTLLLLIALHLHGFAKLPNRQIPYNTHGNNTSTDLPTMTTSKTTTLRTCTNYCASSKHLLSTSIQLQTTK